jgi:hypothetical protein
MKLVGIIGLGMAVLDVYAPGKKRSSILIEELVSNRDGMDGERIIRVEDSP